MTNNLITQQEFLVAKKGSTRDGYGKALLSLGKSAWNVVAVSADLSDSLKMKGFREAYPDRFFEVGVAEQNMVGVAAGLAHEGFIPFAASYAVFSPGRTHDQIRVSVCYSKRNVKIVGGHAGLTVGADGATHQALEDIALMRVLPNMSVLVASDEVCAARLTELAAKHVGPTYLRLSRIENSTLLSPKSIQWGQAVRLKEGTMGTLVGGGMLLDRTLALAYELQEKLGWDLEVLTFPFVKPLDTEAIGWLAQRGKGVMVIEEHQKAGGVGSALAEALVETRPVPMKLCGVEDTFGESGEAFELLDKYGFSSTDLFEKAQKFFTPLM
jgi:transketolase